MHYAMSQIDRGLGRSLKSQPGQPKPKLGRLLVKTRVDEDTKDGDVQRCPYLTRNQSLCSASYSRKWHDNDYVNFPSNRFI
jgi:hypothetical protein